MKAESAKALPFLYLFIVALDFIIKLPLSALAKLQVSPSALLTNSKTCDTYFISQV
jgi:hypothetical protein